MNNKTFISELSQRLGYTLDDTQKMVNTVIDSMNDAFVGGDVVSIPKFGTFEVKKRLERIVINPSTKQRMLVPPKLVLSFKPIASIKEKLKKNAAICIRFRLRKWKNFKTERVKIGMPCAGRIRIIAAAGIWLCMIFRTVCASFANIGA